MGFIHRTFNFREIVENKVNNGNPFVQEILNTGLKVAQN